MTDSFPIDDGSEHPLGTQTSDGELRVQPQGDGTVGWVETALGQHQRWMRNAPDLYERYQQLLARPAVIGPALINSLDDARLVLSAMRQQLAALEQYLAKESVTD